jgi:hypothetical protein
MLAQHVALTCWKAFRAESSTIAAAPRTCSVPAFRPCAPWPRAAVLGVAGHHVAGAHLKSAPTEARPSVGATGAEAGPSALPLPLTWSFACSFATADAAAFRARNPPRSQNNRRAAQIRDTACDILPRHSQALWFSALRRISATHSLSRPTRTRTPVTRSFFLARRRNPIALTRQASAIQRATPRLGACKRSVIVVTGTPACPCARRDGRPRGVRQEGPSWACRGRDTRRRVRRRSGSARPFPRRPKSADLVAARDELTMPAASRFRYRVPCAHSRSGRGARARGRCCRACRKPLLRDCPGRAGSDSDVASDLASAVARALAQAHDGVPRLGAAIGSASSPSTARRSPVLHPTRYGSRALLESPRELRDFGSLTLLRRRLGLDAGAVAAPIPSASSTASPSARDGRRASTSSPSGGQSSMPRSERY